MENNFYEQLNNRNDSGPIILDNNPEFLECIGINKAPITINWETIDKILLKHGIPKEDLYMLNEQIKDNLLITQSLTRDDSILIFISQWDRSGDPILISLALNKKLGEINIHKITSIYGKEKISIMLNNLYKKKKILKCSDMAWNWMKAIGIDVPIDTNFVASTESNYYSKYIVITFI